MKNSINKFLEFNGKAIYFLSVEGEYWVAIKPICEVLNVEYTRQFKNLKSDEIFGEALATQPMVDKGGKVREMVCLPERFVYGWLLSVKSKSQDLKEYKLKCFNLLYDHFHSVITKRSDLLLEKHQLSTELSKLTTKLLEDKRFSELETIKKKMKELNGKLSSLDTTYMKSQAELWDS